MLYIVYISSQPSHRRYMTFCIYFNVEVVAGTLLNWVTLAGNFIRTD